jgi:hypothetical protein
MLTGETMKSRLAIQSVPAADGPADRLRARPGGQGRDLPDHERRNARLRLFIR